MLHNQIDILNTELKNHPEKVASLHAFLKIESMYQ
jgi:hypothetical protein